MIDGKRSFAPRHGFVINEGLIGASNALFNRYGLVQKSKGLFIVDYENMEIS